MRGLAEGQGKQRSHAERIQRRAERSPSGASTFSGRGAVIVLQQATEPLLAAEFAERNRLRFGGDPLLRVAWRPQQLVFFALVRALGMIVLDEFPAQMIHMRLTEHHEVIQAFLLDRLHKPLDECPRVRGANGRVPNLDARGIQRGVERGSKLTISVMVQYFGFGAAGLGLPAKRRRLRFDPGSAGMVRRGRNNYPPRADVQVYQHEQIAKTIGRKHFVGEEVALPERGGVELEKLVPSAWATYQSHSLSICS
jgi:hypothetical protein